MFPNVGPNWLPIAKPSCWINFFLLNTKKQSFTTSQKFFGLFGTCQGSVWWWSKLLPALTVCDGAGHSLPPSWSAATAGSSNLYKFRRYCPLGSVETSRCPTPWLNILVTWRISFSPKRWWSGLHSRSATPFHLEPMLRWPQVPGWRRPYRAGMLSWSQGRWLWAGSAPLPWVSGRQPGRLLSSPTWPPCAKGHEVGQLSQETWAQNAVNS